MSRVWPTIVFARSTHLLFAAGALFLLAYGTDGSRATQSYLRTVCFAERPPEAPAAGEIVEACYSQVCIADACYTYPVLNAPALDRTVLIALLPPHYTIAAKPSYRLCQDGTRIKLTFLPDGTCRASGCYARAELSESLLERIEAADAVSFGIEIPVMGRTISTPLAWRGFPEEFTGAPATSAQDERQRWIRTYLPPALSDFIQ
jgi:Invasion associated locus B (IalB) protein